VLSFLFPAAFTDAPQLQPRSEVQLAELVWCEGMLNLRDVRGPSEWRRRRRSLAPSWSSRAARAALSSDRRRWRRRYVGPAGTACAARAATAAGSSEPAGAAAASTGIAGAVRTCANWVNCAGCVVEYRGLVAPGRRSALGDHGCHIFQQCNATGFVTEYLGMVVLMSVEQTD